MTVHLAEANHILDLADGSTHLKLSGGTLMWAQPPVFAELTLLRGQRDRYYDADGNLVSDVVHGSLTNVCELLAG